MYIYIQYNESWIKCSKCPVILYNVKKTSAFKNQKSYKLVQDIDQENMCIKVIGCSHWFLISSMLLYQFSNHNKIANNVQSEILDT